MMDMAPTPLKDTYYLDNFQRLIDHANTSYRDFLNDNEASWLTTYDSLPDASKCLLVRFYSRKGAWFRSDKVEYPEIPDISKQLTELQRHNLIELPSHISHFDIASNLLTKPEILKLFPSLRKTLSKKETDCTNVD